MDVYQRWDEELDHIPDKLQYIPLYQFRTEQGQIARDTFRPKHRRGKKRYSYSTLSAEGLSSFRSAYKQMVKDYREDLKLRIDAQQTRLFFAALKDWVDGRALRNGPAVRSLKRDVLSYILTTYSTLTRDHIFCEEQVDAYPSGGVSPSTIAEIVKLNEEYINRYLDLIVQGPDDEMHIPDDEMMLHRGINIPWNANIASPQYKEKGFFTSYSLSISVAEKCALANVSKKAIISSKLKHFQMRVLATSLLHRELLMSQLEFLVIPHWYTLELKRHGMFDGMEEYVLGDATNYRGI